MVQMTYVGQLHKLLEFWVVFEATMDRLYIRQWGGSVVIVLKILEHKIDGYVLHQGRL